MKATLKSMIAKGMTAGLLAGAFLFATPKKAEAAQVNIGVQFGLRWSIRMTTMGAGPTTNVFACNRLAGLRSLVVRRSSSIRNGCDMSNG